MKKSVKARSASAPAQVEHDVAGMMARMQQQMEAMERKIDTLIGQSSARHQGRPFEVKQPQAPFQRFEQPHRQSEAKQNNGYRERILHKAVCADCHKGCEVPFRPSPDRPVYCKECFAKRKARGPFKPNHDNRPGAVALAQARHLGKDEGGEDKRAVVKVVTKKRPAAKKRKSKR